MCNNDEFDAMQEHVLYPWVDDPSCEELHADDAMEANADGDWVGPDDEHDPFLTDAEADENALLSAGIGTDEAFGMFDDPYGDDF